MFRHLTKVLSLSLLLSAMGNGHVYGAQATLGEQVKKTADQAYDSLLRTYWRPADRDFVGKNQYWFYAQSIDVATLALRRTPNPLNKSRLEELISAQKARGFLQGKFVYFDDENWMALALIRAAKLTGNRSYLQSAITLFEDILKRADRPEGGVWWNYEKKQVATAINAGSVITGVMLWRETGNVRYLNFAKETYRYWRQKMTSPDGKKIFDNFVGNEINTTTFSYDQGLMVGAALELYKATHQKSYLNESRAYAEYMLQNMRSHDNVMIEEFCIKLRAGCLGSKDLAQFKGIAVLYLVDLSKTLPQDRELRNYLVSTARALIKNSVYSRSVGKIAYEWDGSEIPENGNFPTTNSGALALGALATLF